MFLSTLTGEDDSEQLTAFCVGHLANVIMAPGGPEKGWGSPGTHSLAQRPLEGPWERLLTSPSLGFLIRKVRIIIASAFVGLGEDEISIVHAENKASVQPKLANWPQKVN